MRPIRVVLADDHTLVRQGIKTLLPSSTIRVVAEAADGRELVKHARRLRPDMALVDISMPLLNGIEATRRIAKVSPKTRVIILSMYPDKEYVAHAYQLGAWGYVLKEEAPEHLVEAIEAVAAGKQYFPARMPLGNSTFVDERLTPREREVLQLIAEGKKTSEIAQIMTRSLHTVRNHRARLLKKLGVHNAAELVKAAEEMGLVHLESVRREG